MTIKFDIINHLCKSLRFWAQMTYMGNIELLTFLDTRMNIDYSNVNNF